RDYADLVPRMKAATAEHIYDPAILERSEWVSFWERIGSRLRRARDDPEALFAVYDAARGLKLSHFALLRAGERREGGPAAPRWSVSGRRARCSRRKRSPWATAGRSCCRPRTSTRPMGSGSRGGAWSRSSLPHPHGHWRWRWGRWAASHDCSAPATARAAAESAPTAPATPVTG